MEAARKIRQAVADVAALRQACTSEPGLREALAAVKRLQARRFAGTYADLLAGGPYAAAAKFFLEELYSDKDFAERDAQFARIAGAIEKFFPHDVVETAVALAQLHALTEQLDFSMARMWARVPSSSDPARYLHAWRAVDRRTDRETQLDTVMQIGREMARLTRMPGLRLMLRMMRGPAAAAGLTSLQHFLEAGFDTFGAMARRPGGAEAFLEVIRMREQELLRVLFEEPAVASETHLGSILGQAR